MSTRSDIEGLPRAPRGTREQPAIEADAIRDAPLLLHSIGEFGEVPLGALEVVRPRRIVEIGGEGGVFTHALVDWAERQDAAVLCVDPAPGDALRRLAARTRLELVEGFSPGALGELEPCDVYVLDGDHNYHVVRGELEAISARAPEALVILHDVSWPCARRDFYYGPAHLPAEAVRPHSFTKALRPDSARLVDDGGLTGAGVFGIAEDEGGERNGVLTAVEDHMSTRDELAFARVPCIYGLGFLYPASAEWAGALAGFLAPYDESALLGQLEASRLALLMRVFELQSELERRGAQYDRAVTELERRFADLSAENLRLRMEQSS